MVVSLVATIACGDGAESPWTSPATYAYVVHELQVPRSAAEAVAFGRDVDGRDDDASGGIDNELGRVLAMLSALVPEVDVADATSAALDRGELVLLARLGASDPIAAGRATLAFELGTEPVPAACASATDTTCRHHLAGDGSFALLDGVAPPTPLDGEVASGPRFVGDGGTFVLPLVFMSGSPVARLPFVLATSGVEPRADRLTTGTLAGAIRHADVEAIVYPALRQAFLRVVDAGCAPPRALPGCGCATGTSASALMGTLDTAVPRDCEISLAEVTAVANDLLGRDLDTDGDGLNDAVSFGVGYAAVPATIRP